MSEDWAMIPNYDRENLPIGEWRTFRKIVPTRMIRMEGPFYVETSEGYLYCEDGWLALDARGYPYPLAADEQELIYEEVE